MIEQVLKSYLEHICGKENVRSDEPLSKHTTIRIGAGAKFFVHVTSKEILVKLLSALKYIEYPYRVIGGGSNLLCSDDGFDGVIIRPQFCEIVDNGNFLYADAGASLSTVVRKSVSLGLSGLEFACGIPGTIGGAVFGNAGAHSSCMGDLVTLVDVLVDGMFVSVGVEECKFAYRQSIFQKQRDMIIIGVYLFLTPDSPENINAKISEYTAKRKASQPIGPNAGCTFRNPVGASAGRLIDELGLKGFSIGGAKISEKHANFIINTGEAKCDDVLKIVRKIKREVKAKYGINLKPEIEIL